METAFAPHARFSVILRKSDHTYLTEINCYTIYIYQDSKCLNIYGSSADSMPNPKHFFFKLFFKIILNNEPILTSTLAVGIVLDEFA